VWGENFFFFPFVLRPQRSGAMVRGGALTPRGAVSIETGPNGTSLLNDRSNQILLTVPMREIAEQASRIDALKFKLEQASALL
jgi:hypothetical protein